MLTYQLYNWQQETRTAADLWTTHPVPPAMTGNQLFLNLVLKDAINRQKLMTGKRVNFVNGFNAYGVNAEPLTDSSLSLAFQYQKGTQIAKDAATQQIEAMEDWGLMCDLKNSYITMQPAYQANLLERFADL